MARKVQTWSVESGASRQEAFDYLAEVSKHGEWSPKSYRVEMISEPPLRVGSRFRSYGVIPGDKDHSNDVEVTTLNPPEKLVLTSTDKGESYVSQFDVAAVGSGSRITRTMDAPIPSGFLGVIFPLIFALLIKPDVAKGMRNLQARLDASTSR